MLTSNPIPKSHGISLRKCNPTSSYHGSRRMRSLSSSYSQKHLAVRIPFPSAPSWFCRARVAPSLDTGGDYSYGPKPYIHNLEQKPQILQPTTIENKPGTALTAWLKAPQGYSPGACAVPAPYKWYSYTKSPDTVLVYI